MDAALALYDWNGRATAAAIQTVGMSEVLVRNAMDAALLDWARKAGRSDWLDALPLDARGLADIVEAKRRVARLRGRATNRDQIIPELSFGFWRYLAAPRYLTAIWMPALRNAFPHGHRDSRTRRREVEARLIRLNATRNRAAHHEPLHRRDIQADLDAAIDLATWIAPEVGVWVASQSMIPAILAAKP